MQSFKLGVYSFYGLKLDIIIKIQYHILQSINLHKQLPMVPR